MRTNRIVLCSFLILFILLLLAIFRPSTILINQAGNATAVPHIGQRLKWVRGSEFHVTFLDSNTPCMQDHLDSSQVGKNKWEASCLVIRDLKVGHIFRYAISASKLSEGMLDVRSCSGCVFGSSDIDGSFVTAKDLVKPRSQTDGSVTITCKPGEMVKVDPMSITPSDDNNNVVVWNLGTNNADFTLNFTGDHPPAGCTQPLNIGNNACTFDPASQYYPYSYTVAVAGCTTTDPLNLPKVDKP